MLERVENFSSDRVRDTLSVLIPNTVILGAIRLTDVNILLQIAAAAVTIGYALWRWRRDATKGDRL